MNRNEKKNEQTTKWKTQIFQYWICDFQFWNKSNCVLAISGWTPKHHDYIFESCLLLLLLFPYTRFFAVILLKFSNELHLALFHFFFVYILCVPEIYSADQSCVTIISLRTHWSGCDMCAYVMCMCVVCVCECVYTSRRRLILFHRQIIKIKLNGTFLSPWNLLPFIFAYLLWISTEANIFICAIWVKIPLRPSITVQRMQTGISLYDGERDAYNIHLHSLVCGVCVPVPWVISVLLRFFLCIYLLQSRHRTCEPMRSVYCHR